MATTPADYSRTLENVARGYEKTMEAQSKMWGDIAKLGVNIGKEMTANAQEYASAAAKAAGLDPEGATFLLNEVYDIKDAQKDLGWSIFDDRETRQERAKLKMEQANLFADIDAAVESINVGANAVANGLYDGSLNEEEAEMVNAIIKSNLKNKVTINKNIARLSRDEKTGELIYTLYDVEKNPNGEVLTDASGNPRTMSIKEFSNSIANNVKDDKNVTGTNLGGIINDVITAGQTSKSGQIAPQAIQLGLNRLDNTLITDTDWKRAMGAKFGIQNTSFIEDLTNKSGVSAKLYSDLLQSMKLSKGSQIPAEGVFEGIKDTDGTLGLSLPEINAEYQKYVYNIKNMKDPEASKAAFKDAFATRMGAAHVYGYGNRKIDGGGLGTKTDKNLGIPDWSYVDMGENRNVKWSDARTLKRRLLDGTNFKFNPTGEKGDLRDYDYVDGIWYENYDFDKNKGTEIGTADDMVIDIFKTNHEAFQNLETTVPAGEITVEGETKEVATIKSLHTDIFNKLDVNDDDSASTKLNTTFNLTGSRDIPWQFMPFTTATEEILKNRGGTNWNSPDSSGNDIMLYNSRTGEVLTDANGNRMRFKIGDDMANKDKDSGLSKDVEKLLEALKQVGITPPIQLP
jgi:hypothetical protein